MKHSILFDTDSYKSSHSLQYPPNTTSLFGYIESRGGKFDKTVFFGLQYYLKEYLTHRITVEEVERANKFFKAHMGVFNYDGWKYIAKELDGKIPARIRAVPEGTPVPVLNALTTVESTDAKVPWIYSWLETSLLRVWYPTQVATISWRIKQVIKAALDKSADNTAAELPFKLHDFGGRGVSSQESAMIGGASHLVNFMGGDTVAGILCANEYYHHDMAAFSIPAAEHSSITSWGRDRECDAYRNMLTQFAKPGALLAVVSDSYNLWEAIGKYWGGELKGEVINSGATVIIRPDSGHPPDVVLKSVQMLDASFGHTINTKGYRVLNNVRVIQGDGINEEMIIQILNKLLDAGYSASNVAFGMGGALLQQHNRDTNRWAMKCSSATVNGKQVDVSKDPITDHGKRSKAGRLDLIQGNNGLETIRLNGNYISHPNSVMRTVFENGELLIDDTLEQVRARSVV
jgi:nicotinamide phosphoribosyltransferase